MTKKQGQVTIEDRLQRIYNLALKEPEEPAPDGELGDIYWFSARMHSDRNVQDGSELARKLLDQQYNILSNEEKESLENYKLSPENCHLEGILDSFRYKNGEDITEFNKFGSGAFLRFYADEEADRFSFSGNSSAKGAEFSGNGSGKMANFIGEDSGKAATFNGEKSASSARFVGAGSAFSADFSGYRSAQDAKFSGEYSGKDALFSGAESFCRDYPDEDAETALKGATFPGYDAGRGFNEE